MMRERALQLLEGREVAIVVIGILFHLEVAENFNPLILLSYKLIFGEFIIVLHYVGTYHGIVTSLSRRENFQLSGKKG